MTATLKLPAHELRTGMYVAELDRPWLETPFLFQGFVIRSEREVQEICRYCHWVWIDNERSDQRTALPQTLNGEGPKKGLLVGLKKLLNLPDAPGDDGAEAVTVTRYPHAATSMREELPRAAESIKSAEAIVREATGNVKTDARLESSLIERAVEPIVESALRNKDAMIWLQNVRGEGEYMFSRSVACSVWGVIFGRHLGLDRRTLTTLATGGLLLDLGKISVPDELLTRNGPLSDTEMDLVRRHVEHGVEMLEGSDFDPSVVEMVRTHHERYNGTGYPRGLKGTEIPALGKIAGILDTFVAMTSQRPHADAVTTYEVMRHLNQLADVEFQSELVEQFVQAVGMFPTGSLVELSTGEVGIVTAQNRVRRLRPVVMVVLDENKQLLDHFRTINLREVTTDQSGETSLWIRHGLPPGSYGIDPEEFFL